MAHSAKLVYKGFDVRFEVGGHASEAQSTQTLMYKERLRELESENYEATFYWYRGVKEHSDSSSQPRET